MTKELESLEFICKILNEKRIDIKWLFKNEYNTIKQALLKAQEQEKVLEIIKNKNVLYGQIEYCETVDEYNILIKDTGFDELTQEEFDTLKRCFKNE